MERSKLTDQLVLGDIIENCYKAAGSFGNKLKEALKDVGISNLEAKKTYPLKDFLTALESLKYHYLILGKNVANLAPKGGGVNVVFNSVSTGYGQHHPGGNVGEYKFVKKYDVNSTELVMETNNPYPKDFLKGFLFQLAANNRPKEQVLPPEIEVKELGSNRFQFRIFWKKK